MKSYMGGTGHVYDHMTYANLKSGNKKLAAFVSRCIFTGFAIRIAPKRFDNQMIGLISS